MDESINVLKALVIKVQVFLEKLVPKYQRKDHPINLGLATQYQVSAASARWVNYVVIIQQEQVKVKKIRRVNC